MTADVWARRAYANGLGGDRETAVVDVVRRVVALQGQDVGATRLAVRTRSAGLTAVDVDDAVARGDVVRTWAMRGTLHLVAAADLRWLTAAFGSYFRDRQRPRRTQLGLDDDAGTRLLGHFDAFLLGYRERNVPDRFASVLQTGGGFVMPAISAGGRLVGSWRLSTKDILSVTRFTGIPARTRQGLEREAADLGRFLDRSITLGDVGSASTA